MRILQLIDSLEPGGAERMAVNYANALVGRVEFTGLIATRSEGALMHTISAGVSYLFLQRKKSFDVAAVRKLYRYIKENNITVIHAHSTSLYIAIIVKLLLPKLVIVWHDHYGNSEYLSERPSTLLRFLLRFCDCAIAVNIKLENWIRERLGFRNTIYLPNFAALDLSKSGTTLNGSENFRIICLANLREQKNHVLLLKVAARLKVSHPQWTFHLVGKDFHDDYSLRIHNMVKDLNLVDSVFLYGSCDDTAALIEKCDIAVLSSKSEGLPVALLEYGLLSKPVLATSVGEIPSIIQDGKNGYLATSENEQEFYSKLICLIEDDNRPRLGIELHKTISSTYSAESIIDTYLRCLKKL